MPRERHWRSWDILNDIDEKKDYSTPELLEDELGIEIEGHEKSQKRVYPEHGNLIIKTIYLPEEQFESQEEMKLI